MPSMLENVQKMLKAENRADPSPSRVITVRMPKELHEALKDLAHELGTSLNHLCVTIFKAATDDDADPISDDGITTDLLQSDEGGRRPL